MTTQLGEILERHLATLNQAAFLHMCPTGDYEGIPTDAAQRQLEAAIREAWHAGAADALARHTHKLVWQGLPPTTDPQPPRMPVLPKPVWVEPPVTSREQP